MLFINLATSASLRPTCPWIFPHGLKFIWATVGTPLTRATMPPDRPYPHCAGPRRLNNRSGYPVDRFMNCPLGTISKRSRLEVCLEDRLQHELERTLHHSNLGSQESKGADLAPSFGFSCRRAGSGI
jgi:hypothetical protein